MPKISDLDKQNRRQQIIDAAYRCFARKGFHQTSMRDIFEEAQLSAGAVYHYFRSKEEIIAGSFQFDYERSLDLFSAAVASNDPMQALEELVAFFLNGLKGAANVGASRVNVQGWGEALVNPKIEKTVLEVMDSYRNALSRLIARGQEVGQLDPALDPVAVSQLLMSIYYGLELQLALNPQLEVDKYNAAVKSLLRSISSKP